MMYVPILNEELGFSAQNPRNPRVVFQILKSYLGQEKVLRRWSLLMKKTHLPKQSSILLMVQKSGVHQLRLVVYPHNLQGFMLFGSSEPSTVGLSKQNAMIWKLTPAEWWPLETPEESTFYDAWRLNTKRRRRFCHLQSGMNQE